MARPGDMVLIENPESHLHPKGQSAIGRLLAATAANGVQIFCESHSDHIINGVRVAVKEGIIQQNQLAVYYFSRDLPAEYRFIQATCKLNEPEEMNYNGAVTEGLAWAYIRETLCISFPVNSVWRKTNICLREEKGQENSLVLAFHASQLAHIAFHQAWIDSLKEIVLIETDTLPSQKKVNLRKSIRALRNVLQLPPTNQKIKETHHATTC